MDLIAELHRVNLDPTLRSMLAARLKQSEHDAVQLPRLSKQTEVDAVELKQLSERTQRDAVALKQLNERVPTPLNLHLRLWVSCRDPRVNCYLTILWALYARPLD